MPVQQINVKNSSDIESWEWGGGCGRETVRAGSGSSQTSCSNSSGDICRICHCESEVHNPLLAPCYCSGECCNTLHMYNFTICMLYVQISLDCYYTKHIFNCFCFISTNQQTAVCCLHNTH